MSCCVWICCSVSHYTPVSWLSSRHRAGHRLRTKSMNVSHNCRPFQGELMTCKQMEAHNTSCKWYIVKWQFWGMLEIDTFKIYVVCEHAAYTHFQFISRQSWPALVRLTHHSKPSLGIAIRVGPILPYYPSLCAGVWMTTLGDSYSFCVPPEFWDILPCASAIVTRCCCEFPKPDISCQMAMSSTLLPVQKSHVSCSAWCDAHMPRLNVHACVLILCQSFKQILGPKAGALIALSWPLWIQIPYPTYLPSQISDKTLITGKTQHEKTVWHSF